MRIQSIAYTRAKSRRSWALFAFPFALALLNYTSNPLHLEVQEIVAAQEEKLTDASIAFVTFVTPSRMTRGSLHDTISSLQNQTMSLWKAVVGVDISVSPFKSQKDVNTQLHNSFATNTDDNFVLSSSEKDDERLKFVAVDTQSTRRGQNENGAGKVRNLVIQQHVDTEWVAFVDDDDTLSPYYVQHLQHAMRQNLNADVFIFRMRYRKSGRFVPPYANVKNGTLWPSTVGISFAVRRRVFTSADNPILFGSNHLEDFLFIQKAHQWHKKIMLTTCIDYFIRSLPKHVNEHDCECFPLLHVWDAIPGQSPPTV